MTGWRDNGRLAAPRPVHCSTFHRRGSRWRSPASSSCTSSATRSPSTGYSSTRWVCCSSSASFPAHLKQREPSAPGGRGSCKEINLLASQHPVLLAQTTKDQVIGSPLLVTDTW